MKILLAGPGTGKTTRVKEMIRNDFANANRILVLSFTNATVNDLTGSFKDWSNVECHTLHSYALRINHLTERYILDDQEESPIIESVAEDIGVDFQELCGMLECITFDAMILECLRSLRTNPAYGREKIGTLDLLIVDEFQDFNPVERELVYLLSTYAGEAIILGDDDQSIYGFKDADPDGIIALFNDAAVERIPHDHKCHRCPDSVVEYGTKLIRKNQNRIAKPWHKTMKPGEVVTGQFLTQEEINRYIASEIGKIWAAQPDTSILVLSPVGFYVDELVTMFQGQEIAHVNFWEKNLAKSDYYLVWWLRAIYTHRVVLNLIFLSKALSAYRRKKFRALLEGCVRSNFDQKGFIERVSGLFEPAICRYLRERPDLAQLSKEFPKFVPLVTLLDEADPVGSVGSLLRRAQPKKDFQCDSVNLMSIHKSKGLQADIVFITGLTDGVLPNRAKGLDTMEAQRRLLFVGMTRAQKMLYLLSSVEWDGKFVHRLDESQFQYSHRKRKWNGRTSKFVDEMK